MQHISELTSKAVTSKNSTESNLLDEVRVKRIFALMQAEYGSRWVDQTGTGNALKLSVQVWRQKLFGLTDEQVKYGLNNLPEDFPPTPTKFKSICKKLHEEWEHNTAAYKLIPKSRRIDVPDEIKQQRLASKNKAIAECRRKLGAA